MTRSGAWHVLEMRKAVDIESLNVGHAVAIKEHPRDQSYIQQQAYRCH